MRTLTTTTGTLAHTVRDIFEAANPEATTQTEKRTNPITPILLTLASPFIALLFLIFLPLVGFGMLFWMVGQVLFGVRKAPAAPPETPSES